MQGFDKVISTERRHPRAQCPQYDRLPPCKMSLYRALGRACLRWVLLQLLFLFRKSPHIKLGIRDEHFQTLFFSRMSIPQTETQHFVSLPPFHAPSVLSVMQLSPFSCQLCLMFSTEHVWEAKQPPELSENRHQEKDFLLSAFVWSSFKKAPILWPIC